MSEGWTPGPWVVFNSEQITPADARLGDPAVAIVAVRDEQEQKANARLLASAPELLETLSELIAVVETYDDANTPGTDLWDTCRLASEAERKARGVEHD